MVLHDPSRRLLLGAAMVAMVALLGPLPLVAAEPAPRPPPVIDLHVDLSYQVNFRGRSLADGTGQMPARELLPGGVAGVVLPLYVPRWASELGPREQDWTRSRQRLLELLPSTPPYALPGCAVAEGKVRTWFALEGAGPLAAAPERVGHWVQQGVRLFGLVHTWHNELATSSGAPNPAGRGLTERGREVVARVHAAGASVDVSHASDAATEELIALARRDGRPLVATHSNARRLAPHPRNLSDGQLRGIASTGGVVGVNFHSSFLVRGRRAKLADVVRHVQHLVQIMGVEHVALGSDYEGDIRPAVGLESARQLPRLAAALRAKGMSEGDVEKVFARNALRVLCPSE